MGASVNSKVLPSGQPGQWSAGPGQCNDATSRLRRQGLVSLDALFCCRYRRIAVGEACDAGHPSYMLEVVGTPPVINKV